MILYYKGKVKMINKILITGANGYIGNCLYHFLKGKFKVIGLDKEKTSNNKRQFAKLPI